MSNSTLVKYNLNNMKRTIVSYLMPALLMLMLPALGFSQDCSLKNDKDADNQPRLSTGFLSFGVGSSFFLLSMDAGKKDIDLFFVIKGSGPECFDEESTVTINFDDGKTKMTLKNTGPTNCNRILHVTFRNGPVTHTYLQRLSTRKVASFHIVGTDKTADIHLSEQDKILLMNRASCVAVESKTIL
jgi:hypothetical protein